VYVSHFDRGLSDIERILRDLTRGIDTASTSERVEAGQTLQSILSSTKKALDRVKDTLRADAAGKFKGSPSLVLEGTTSVATVSAPEPITRLAKNADVAALRAALGEDFGDFFQEQHLIQPRPEALPRILTLPLPIRDLVLRCLEQDVGSGGVGFSQKRRT